MVDDFNGLNGFNDLPFTACCLPDSLRPLGGVMGIIGKREGGNGLGFEVFELFSSITK